MDRPWRRSSRSTTSIVSGGADRPVAAQPGHRLAEPGGAGDHPVIRT